MPSLTVLNPDSSTIGLIDTQQYKKQEYRIISSTAMPSLTEPSKQSDMTSKAEINFLQTSRPRRLASYLCYAVLHPHGPQREACVKVAVEADETYGATVPEKMKTNDHM